MDISGVFTGGGPMTNKGHWHLTWHGIKAKYIRHSGEFPFGGKSLGIVWCDLQHDHPSPATSHYWDQ